MGPLIWALFGITAFLFIIALFARGGAHETFSPSPSRTSGPSGPATGGRELAEMTRRLLTAMGFTVESVKEQPDGRADLLAHDANPVTGQRVYARTFPGGPTGDADPVGTSDVQAALDAARGGGYHRALLVSPGGFSDEALSAAEGTTVELIDGSALSDLVRKYMKSEAPGQHADSPG